jgi:hypothetical protein
MTPQKYVRFSNLRDWGIVNNWTTLRRWIKAGRFPPGRMIDPNSRAWTAQEVTEFQQQLDADAVRQVSETPTREII